MVSALGLDGVFLGLTGGSRARVQGLGFKPSYTALAYWSLFRDRRAIWFSVDAIRGGYGGGEG